MNLNPLVLLCVLMGLWSILILGLWSNVRGKYNSILSEFNAPNADALMEFYKRSQSDLVKVQEDKAKSAKEWKIKYEARQKDLERENRLLQKERDELRVKYEGPDKEEEESRLLLREEAFQNQLVLLQEAMRKEAKRNILERFGPGPHEVEFTFLIEGVEKSFVIEMAPIDEVPHAVHVFLEQVEHELWNGCYFYLNGPHVIQAGPPLSEEDDANGPTADNEDEDRYSTMRPFRALGLDRLAFPDYSNNFPHLPWTLGFTGRPGGPDFYINKVDNSESHGPGGQYHHALEEQGDSCFAKITRGKENAAALFAQPVYGDRSEWHHFIVEPVEIIQAKILTKRPMEGTLSVPKVDTPANETAATNPDPVKVINEKLKRKPKLPKIEHAVEP